MKINDNEIFRSDSTDFPSVKEYLRTSLKSLRRKHKGLTLKKCRYLEKTFNHVHDYRGGDNEALVSAIAPHAFNDHTMCKVSWCPELQKNFSQVSKIDFDEKHLIIMDLKDMFSTTLAFNSSELLKSSQDMYEEAEDVVTLLPSPPDTGGNHTYNNKKRSGGLPSLHDNCEMFSEKKKKTSRETKREGREKDKKERQWLEWTAISYF